ncbi:cupin domain-containing protein [Altererythrobacter aerius]|uniref:Cupin domain-containing protein n=1 Tax=Tsuneonella aeria TaxID=1837929 RepID=A0A6I4TE81_9SPHN|nr:cupin domain-containing protein [Tsuneonella aeria]MXO74946.1 cupin domain-containing protein [Tsuneonella aeria]
MTWFPGFDVDRFLRESWQQAPLLIPNPWPRWENPLEPDELAGLACEEDVESRLVIRTGDGWALEHGPFAADRFGDLGREAWTLLVQSVDHFVPAVADLLRPFRFVPNWRVDDVMVSYATDGGGVGPHYDQYDVFLVQGLGRRRWQVGARCDGGTALLPHDDLRLLAQFEPTHEWTLEPGDILYVPPGYAHDGIAVGDDCMTYSVGFRAPSRADLIADWSDHALETLTEDDRYTDGPLDPNANPGEIAPGALDRLHDMVARALLDRAGFARWFGAYSTSPKLHAAEWEPEAPLSPRDVRAMIERAIALVRNPASRFAFVRRDGGEIDLFVDGRAYPCAGPAAAFAEMLCASEQTVVPAALRACDEIVDLLAHLANSGSVAFDAGD